MTNNLISADLEINPGGCAYYFIVNAYLRGRYLHVFEGVAYFIFKYFSLKIAFVFVSNRQKKLSNETTTYFSINTQVCFGHVLSLELSIKTILT